MSDEVGIDWEALRAELGTERVRVTVPITRRTLDEFLFCHRWLARDSEEEITPEWVDNFTFVDEFKDNVADFIARAYTDFLIMTDEDAHGAPEG